MTYNAKNQTFICTFVLLGLTDDDHLQLFLFFLFFLMYSLAIVGNINIIIVFLLAPSLQTPMYFFLSHLSFSDLCYSSVITPKLLDILIAGDTSLSYIACMLQLIFFSVFGSLESLILALMAWDRSVAVSRPLLYCRIMTASLSFCGPVNIHHFYCDYPPLLKLACSDTHVNELVLLCSVAFVSGISVVTIMTSYDYIIHIVLGIRSARSRYKIFYTCSSHLTVVFMFYEQDKVVAVFYTVAIPALNPVIYSLRNKELHTAIRKITGKRGIHL
ncbi:hypothetical protein GDO78_000269 [Eleutherodactylus coqui]|uniref:G-protein coupled receptors family 1 profile domain-containing protein n=1 Tax=Eleutherodactylus coqui TaxID=57060 RepID=A0A8J6FPS0_ELECQ|nr:hypothetical protein GDO78_000269 [Eleutherodactylus coqui]